MNFGFTEEQNLLRDQVERFMQDTCPMTRVREISKADGFDSALFFSDKVITQFQPKTGKSEYINALSHFNIGGEKRACELLLQSINYGYSQAQTTYDQRCN